MHIVQKSAAGNVDLHRPIGELVLEQPVRARLFEKLHIDYCCAGQQTLTQACTNAGVQLEAVQAALQTLGELDTGFSERERTDWREVDTAQLCQHIVGVHHEFLRRSLPRIDSLISTVVRVHGTGDRTLSDLPRVFGTIRSALEPHLGSEEAELFPAILAAEQGGPRVPEEMLAGHECEHAEVGAALAEMRGLCDGYDRDRALCNTHRAMLDALEELELDIHQHVHEENNVLFPRARAARTNLTETPHSPSRLAAEPSRVINRTQMLPACCQGWVAEQGQRWVRTRRGR